MNKLIRDDIEKFYHYGVDIPSKTLFIGSGNYSDDEPKNDGGVNYIMAEKAVKGLHILDSKNRNKAITILMNNVGGDEYHGLAIYDAIKACKSKTRIKVYGHAMSMGAWILQAADKRYLSQHSTVMIHYGTWEFAGHALDAKETAKENDRLCSLMEDHLLQRIKEKHPRYTRETLQELMRFDRYLTSSQAIELGLADSIIR